MKKVVGSSLNSLKKSRFNTPGLFAFILIFGGIGGWILIASNAAPVPQASTHANQASLGRLVFLGQQLQLAGADIAHNPDRSRVLVPKLGPIAKERAGQLSELFKNDPVAARNLVLPNALATTLGKNNLDVERPVTLSGSYRRLQIDEPSGDHIYSQLVTADKKVYTLDTEQIIPRIVPNSTVSVSGLLLGDQLLVDQAPETIHGFINNSPHYSADQPAIALSGSGGGSFAPIQVTNVGSVSPTTGTINQAVIMANFSGGDSAGVDINKIKAVYSGTPGADVADYAHENSGGRTTLVPTYLGVYNLSSNTCNYNSNNSETNAMIAAAGGSSALSSYHLLTFITNCNEGGWASVGGGITQQQSYVGNSDSLEVNAHEFAHTLGNLHGGYIDCGPQGFGLLINSAFDDGTCTIGEYQDPYDALGGQPGSLSGDLSPIHKLTAGWLDSTNITTDTTPGTTSYTLAPYEQTKGLVAVKIPLANSGAFFTVEYRQPLGFDSYITGGSCTFCNANKGALIRLSGVGNSSPQGGTDSNIIDNTPGSHTSANTYWPVLDGDDGTLLPGQIFTDPDYSISIKAISADTSGLTIQVTLGSAACAYAAPTVSAISPSAQTVAPGKSANYTFTVTNNDSSGCAPDQFRFGPVSQEGFGNGKVNLVASPDYFTLAPGASTSVTLTAISDPSATDSTYFNSLGSSGYIQSRPFGIPAVRLPAFTYQLLSPSDTTSPSAPTNFTAKTLGASAASFSWNASTDNTGVAGYRLTLNGSTQENPAGTSWTMIGLVPSTSYSATIQAFDHKSNLSAPASISFTTPPISSTVIPSPAGNLNVSTTDHSYNLTWSKAYDPIGMACYIIANKYGYAVRCNTPADKPSYTLTGIPSQTAFNGINIVGFDGDGNSSSSQPLTFSTSAAGSTTGPSRPAQLYVQSQTINGNLLTWQPSTDDKSITGYNVFRGCCKFAFTTNTNSYFDPINSTTSYRVQAVDAAGSLSPISNTFGVTGSGTSADTAPPTALVTSPANGSTSSGIVTFQTSASDNAGAVGLVSYYIDGIYVGQSTAGPSFPLNIDTTKYSDGPHWLLAEAQDNVRNSGTSGPINVNFNNGGGSITPPDTSPPSVSVTSPANGSTISGSVTISVTASDNIGVSKVEFYIDGTLKNTSTVSPYSFVLDTTTLSNGSHSIMAKAYDAAFNSSSASVTVNAANGDTTPPTAPSGLTASASAYNRVNLSWSTSTDNLGVSSYYVVRNGTTIAQVSGTSTSYSDTSVTALTTYSYQVIASDAAGNTSNLSNTATVTTPSVPDTQAPTAPTNLNASAVSSSQVNLSWTASTDNIGVTAYDVYRNGGKVSSVTGSVTSYGDAGLTAFTTYSYYVIAKDAAGNSSAVSNTVSVTTPPIQVTGSLLGTIYSSKGGTVAGASVSLKYSGSNHTYTSDSFGNYSITGIPGGSYTVKYSKQGFNSLSRSVIINLGATTTQNVTLISRK